MANTVALTCQGDDARPGCGRPVAMVDHGEVHALKRSEILSFDRDGRASVRCLECHAVTLTRGHLVRVR